MDFDQIESEILALIVNVEFSVALARLGSDMLLYAGGNVSRANLLFGATCFGCSGCSCEKSTGAGVKNNVMAAAMMILAIM